MALVSPLRQAQRRLSSGGGGEDQAAHPNAITPVGAHTFCPPLNPWQERDRGYAEPGDCALQKPSI